MNFSRGKEPGRIAILGTLPPLRGLSSYCRELALALAEAMPVEFISFKKLYPSFAYPGGDLRKDDTFPAVVHPNLIVQRRLTWYNPLGWMKAGFCNSARLLHAQWWSLPLFPVYLTVCCGFKLRGRPVVVTVHNTRPHERSFLYRKLSGVIFKLADHLIVHTVDGKKQLTSDYGIDSGRVSLIPHGLLNFQVKNKPSRSALRAALGFTPESRVILLFGTIRPYKGIDTAMRAFARLLPKLPEARLLIAGKPWECWERYANLIKELDLGPAVSTHLEYIPADEVYKYFDAADIVILPYHHFDSQSGVGASAVSFRKPLIVTRVGGLPELAGDPRCVVPPGDAAALADMLVECLSETGRLETMAAGAEVVAQKLTWPAIIDKTRAVYSKMLTD